MAKRRSMRCLWLVVLAEVALAACPFAVQAQEAGNLTGGFKPDKTAAVSRVLLGEEMPLYLETSVNRLRVGVVHFTMRGGELWSSPDSLEQLGLSAAASSGEARLRDVPGLRFDYDAAGQSLSITVPISSLRGEATVVESSPPVVSEPVSGTGLVYNYNLFGGVSGESRIASAYSELRVFSPQGVVSGTFLAQASSAKAGGSLDAVRLDTSATASFPHRVLVAKAGDSFTAATSWSRSTRFGGLQIGTDFAMQPYAVTTPLTQFFGETALPSQVELYVDGMKQVTGDVPPGRFQITTPVTAGAGASAGKVVITDALGQVSTVAFALYQTPVLLRPGLTDWTVEAGFLRQSYGVKSFDYAPQPFASGTARRGLTDRLTLEAHGEASARLALGGVGANWRAGQLGVLSGSVAHSRSSKSTGIRYDVGYTWSAPRTLVSFDLAKAGRGFRDLAALEDSPLPRRSISAQISHSIRNFGTFGASYVDLEFEKQPRSRFVTAYWSKALGQSVGLNVHASVDLENRRNRSIFATLSVTLGNRSTVSASLQRDHDSSFGSIDAFSSVPDSGGFGWRAQLSGGGARESAGGEVQYQGGRGRVIAGGRMADGALSGYAGASGSLVFTEGSLFAAREVYDSFAVVSTDGIANVPVLLHNNVVGRTGAGGKLLVTGLNAYENNRIAINVLDLPPDVRSDRVERIVAPSDRSGAVVRFKLRKVRAATLILTDSSGAFLPVGSLVQVRGGKSEPAVVGFDGAVYAEALGDENVVDVDTPAGRCVVQFEYPVSQGVLPRIGPLICTVAGVEK